MQILRLGSVPGLGRSPGEGVGSILGLPWWFRQYRGWNAEDLGTVQMVKSLQCERPGFNPWVRNIPWRRAWQPTAVFLPGKSHGQRSLAGYGPWGHKELDTTEWACTHKASLLQSQVMPSHCILTWSSFCQCCLCPNPLFLSGHKKYWIRAQLYDFILHQLFL